MQTEENKKKNMRGNYWRSLGKLMLTRNIKPERHNIHTRPLNTRVGKLMSAMLRLRRRPATGSEISIICNYVETFAANIFYAVRILELWPVALMPNGNVSSRPSLVHIVLRHFRSKILCKISACNFEHKHAIRHPNSRSIVVDVA